MKKIIIIISVILGLTTVLFIVKYKTDKEHTTHIEKNIKSVKYHCPMHPTYISDKPGDCPICGMKLVPMEEKIQEGGGIQGKESIIITQERQQQLGIKTEVIKKKNIEKTVRTVGQVAHDPELYYAEEEYISSLRAYDEIKNSNVSENIKRAKSLLDSVKFKLKHLGLNEKEIEELAKKGVPDKSLLITEENENFWVYAQVYENELKFVKAGQYAKITIPSDNSQTFQGRIIALDPVLNPETRSVRARILIEKKIERLRPERYVNVEIKILLGNQLVVADSAVIDTGTRQVVFIVKEKGVFEPREVILGEKVDDYYIVKSGVSEGEKVVVSANFLIDSESQLKSVLKEMKSEHKH